VPTPYTFGLPSGVLDGEGEYVSEIQMGDGDARERPDVVQPTSDTPMSVFDGGGDDTCETLPASVEDNRPIKTRAYIIRVDHLKETCDKRKRPGVVQPTSATHTGVFDGGGDDSHEMSPSSVADSRLITTRAYTVRLNDMGKINNQLKDKRDKLNVDKLKLCSAATQSEDDVANE